MPPRPLRPKNESALHDGSDVVEGRGGRKKAVSSACLPCRKRKSKCDGQLPACSTCVAVYRTECYYDENSDFRRKGALKREVQNLQQQNDALDVIVDHLRTLPEQDALALLQHLRNDTHLDSIAESLRNNVGLPSNFASQTLEADFAQGLTTPASTAYESDDFRPSPSRASSRDSQALSHMNGTPISEQPTSWFRIPQDAELIEHLLSLYQCWIQPFYCFFLWDVFVQDMGRGRLEFCSALLVNAVLSFACHYSDRSAARTDPNDPSTAGDHFFAEAKRLLDLGGTPCLTTVQALGIMSLRETSAGRDSNGYQLAGRCVRMSLELGLHLSVIRQGTRQPEAEVRKVVFWAVFNMETICAVAFGRLSGLPRSAADIETPSTNIRSEQQTWRPYEDTNLSISPSAEQPARSMLFKDHLSKLSELASDMVNTFYAPRERFTSRRLATTYRLYQQWYSNLPDCFRLENTSLPHVLVLHMYYYGCVLHLFRPYIKYDLHGANLYPRDTCTHCANEISALMNALRAMYGLRRVCLAVISLVMSASTIHLLNLPSEPAAAHLSQGLHDLEAMSTNHRFAGRAVDIIRSLSNKWQITLPEAAAAVTVYRNTGSMRDVSPPPPSTFFAASLPRTGSSESRSRSNDGVRESPFGPPNLQPMRHEAPTSMPTFYSDTTPLDSQQAQNAFWTPFPTQGMPMPPHGLDATMLEFTHQWPRFGGEPAGPFGQHHPGRQASAPGRLDEAMGGMTQWNWG